MSKIFLKVPFAQKDEAKGKGARFDSESKLWYCPSGLDLTQFIGKWDAYIECPFSEKDEAKSKGARFDGDSKKWYIVAGSNLQQFLKWLPPGSVHSSHSVPPSVVQKSPTKVFLKEGIITIVVLVLHTMY